MIKDKSALRPINVDVHWDFARSIQVMAHNEDEAVDIVERMMLNGEISFSSFEGAGIEYDTSYQPE